MKSIMAAIPPMFTPRKSSSGGVDSARATPQSSTSIIAQDSPRLKRKTPASSKRKSFVRKLLYPESMSPKEDEGREQPEDAGTGATIINGEKDGPEPKDDDIADGIHVNTEDTNGQDRNVEAGGTDDGEEYIFKRFLSHKWVENAIELEVEWDSGEITWEPEVNLHHDAPDYLFEYWREQGGRPANPVDPEMFEVFAIRKHNKNRSRLQVEWVGYEPSEASWVPRKVIEETAADVVEAYFDNLKKPRGRKR